MKTCRDCKYWCSIWDNEGICVNKKDDRNECFADDNICSCFETTDGKRPRFCRLASNVEEMAKALVCEHRFAEDWVYCCVAPTEKGYDDYDEALAAAKNWLMEEE